MGPFYEEGHYIVVLVIIAIIVYLIYRPIHLWYNQIQRRTDLLESIDESLKAIKKHLKIDKKQDTSS